MATKIEPMECESEMEDSFRIQAFNHGIMQKSIDLTDDQMVMQIPSPDEPYITGIFHRSSDQIANRQSLNRLPSDVSLMQHSHFYHAMVKANHPREVIDEEYPTYTIARSESELNSRSLPKKYKCKFCIYKTSYKSDLNRHLRRHAKKDNAYNCDICNMPFRSLGKVYNHKQQIHMLNDNDELTLGCSLCSFRCTEKDIELYQLHTQQHIDDNTCNVCSKSFNNPEAVDKHKKIFHQVTNEVVFPPQRSVPYFPDEASASAVPESQDAESEPPRQVESSASSRTVSNSSTPISAENDSSSRRDHSKTVVVQEKEVNASRVKWDGNNLSEKLVQNKNLSQITNPEICTRNILEAEVPLPRTTCKKESNEPITNKELPVKKLKCENCGQGFTVMRELLVHLSVCLRGELKKKDNFNCPMCNFTAEALESFYNHMIKHTFDKFSCDICNKPFSHYRNVLYHKRKIHRIDQRKKRSPTKLKALNIAKVPLLSLKSHASPYSTETAGQIKQLADKELKMENGILDDEDDKSFQDTNTSGRYTRLVSNFDDFIDRPFACSLCFFRTSNVNKLISHVKNHISGCNDGKLPDVVRFNFNYKPTSDSVIKLPETVYNITMNAMSSKSDLNAVHNAVIDTESKTSGTKDHFDQSKQIKFLENLLTNSRKRKKMFVSRISNCKAPEKKAMSCDLCHKEFSMRILARRHMEKIHNIKKNVN